MLLHKKTAKEIAYDYIKDRIISGEYKPNYKIDDIKIATELGVSKMPIREAIQVLVSQNFLTSTPKVGTTVTELKIKDIYQIYEPLAVIQGLAARNACLLVNQRDIKVLKQINEELAQAIKDDNYAKAMNLDKEFHEYFLVIANNPYITNFCNELLMQIQRLESIFLSTFTSFQNSVAEHNLIIEALENRDEEKASKNMENNWLTSIPNINIRSLSRLVNAIE